MSGHHSNNQGNRGGGRGSNLGGYGGSSGYGDGYNTSSSTSSSYSYPSNQYPIYNTDAQQGASSGDGRGTTAGGGYGYTDPTSNTPAYNNPDRIAMPPPPLPATAQRNPILAPLYHSRGTAGDGGNDFYPNATYRPSSGYDNPVTQPGTPYDNTGSALVLANPSSTAGQTAPYSTPENTGQNPLSWPTTETAPSLSFADNLSPKQRENLALLFGDELTKHAKAHGHKGERIRWRCLACPDGFDLHGNPTCHNSGWADLPCRSCAIQGLEYCRQLVITENVPRNWRRKPGWSTRAVWGKKISKWKANYKKEQEYKRKMAEEEKEERRERESRSTTGTSEESSGSSRDQNKEREKRRRHK